MVSSTKQTTRRRRTRAAQRARWNKKDGSTPPVAVHPEGYDSKAPDARPPAAKASDTKPSPTKASDTKPSATKASNTRSAAAS